MQHGAGDVIKSVFDQIKNDHRSLCENINFIETIASTRTAESDLEHSNIEFDEVLKFTDDSFKSATSEGYTMANAGAYTVNFLYRGAPKSAIFLNSTALGINKESHETIFWSVQTLFLYHELMHVQDLKNGKNFDIQGRTVDLVKAEIYADVKTLRYFDNLKKDGGDFFRNMYAAGIIGREKSPIYTRIFNGITKVIPKAQLQAWASASPLPPAKNA